MMICVFADYISSKLFQYVNRRLEFSPARGIDYLLC